MTMIQFMAIWLVLIGSTILATMALCQRIFLNEIETAIRQCKFNGDDVSALVLRRLANKIRRAK